MLAFFVIQGLVAVGALGTENLARQFTPFAPFGTGGLIAHDRPRVRVYAGLTKVASVAEEVQNPDRNIPLGMALSLFTATFIYVVGVFIMVAVLDPSELRLGSDARGHSGGGVLDWLPGAGSACS